MCASFVTNRFDLSDVQNKNRKSMSTVEAQT